MNQIPESLVQTWLFLINSHDDSLAPQKYHAYRMIKKYFTSIELAELYLEQQRDDEIEVMVI